MSLFRKNPLISHDLDKEGNKNLDNFTELSRTVEYRRREEEERNHEGSQGKTEAEIRSGKKDKGVREKDM